MYNIYIVHTERSESKCERLGKMYVHILSVYTVILCTVKEVGAQTGASQSPLN